MMLGVVPAGEVARRFQSDKAVVMLNGETVLSHTIGARAVDIFDKPVSIKIPTEVTVAEERNGL
jgi:molybdopterin-guanine dinucleotide biosynthesis protein A